MSRLQLLAAAAVFAAASVSAFADVDLPPEAQAQLKEKAAHDLIDPDSAQFRNVRFVGTVDKPTMCGEINAKNRFGGYVGFRAFMYADSQMVTDEPDQPPVAGPLCNLFK
jgi:hypothetical protein